MKRKPEGWSAVLKTPEERRRFDRLCRERKRSKAMYQPTNVLLALRAMDRTHAPGMHYRVRLSAPTGRG